MKQTLFPLLALATATAALADTPMSGAQFEAYVLGRTYTYGHPGLAPYGIEAYHPNRQVTWAYFHDQCVEGYWYEADDNAICFVYPHDSEHKCWWFFKEDDQLRAEFLNDPAELDYEVVPTTQSVPCLGPEVGV